MNAADVFLRALSPRRFTIRHPDGSAYITRWLLHGCPSLEEHDREQPWSAFIHELHTPDGDAWMHSHPWAWSVGIILSGGYTERRRTYGRLSVEYTYRVGDANMLELGDYHSIIAVEPNTRTLFLTGREIQDWGFLVDGIHIPHREYFKRPDAVQMTHTEDK